MSACNDFINLDNSADWVRIVGRTFTAVSSVGDSYIPIGEKDLGVSVDESYLVAVVQPTNLKPTWVFGGKFRRDWNFPKGAEIGSLYSKAKSAPIAMGINKPQIINFPKSGAGSYRLTYEPPRWFKEVIVIVWKYVGDVDNFTKDTLFDIGNRLGVGTLNEPDSIPNLIANLQTTLTEVLDRITNLESTISSPSNSIPLSDEQLTQISSVVSQNVSQINREINNLESNLGDVLSGESEPEVLDSNIVSFLEDEFI